MKKRDVLGLNDVQTYCGIFQALAFSFFNKVINSDFCRDYKITKKNHNVNILNCSQMHLSALFYSSLVFKEESCCSRF